MGVVVEAPFTIPFIMACGVLYRPCLIEIMACISNHTNRFMWDIITHPCPNFVDVRPGSSNCIPLFYVDVITHLCSNPDADLTNLVKGDPDNLLVYPCIGICLLGYLSHAYISLLKCRITYKSVKLNNLSTLFQLIIIFDVDCLLPLRAYKLNTAAVIDKIPLHAIRWDRINSTSY